MESLELLTHHPFLHDMSPEWLDKLSYQAKRAVYHPGYRIFHEGGHADRFWLIREGEVQLDMDVHDHGDVVIDTIGAGSVLGWSWLTAPYRWHFGATATRHTLAVEFDAAGVLRLCDDDPALGYELTRRFMEVLIVRLQRSRERLSEIDAAAVQAR